MSYIKQTSFITFYIDEEIKKLPLRTVMNSKLIIQLLYGLALEAFILRLMEETGRQSKSGSKVSGLHNIWSRGYGRLSSASTKIKLPILTTKQFLYNCL